jgi:hypothetical protein
MASSIAKSKPNHEVDVNLINKNGKENRNTPPRKRMAPSIAKSKPSREVDVNLIYKSVKENHNDSDLRVKSGVNNGVRSPKRRKRKLNSVALPFGSILAETPKKRNDYI